MTNLKYFTEVRPTFLIQYHDYGQSQLLIILISLLFALLFCYYYPITPSLWHEKTLKIT